MTKSHHLHAASALRGRDAAARVKNVDKFGERRVRKRVAPSPRGARLLAVRVERDDVGERFARGDPELDARVERDLRAGADGRARLEFRQNFDRNTPASRCAH